MSGRGDVGRTCHKQPKGVSWHRLFQSVCHGEDILGSKRMFHKDYYGTWAVKYVWLMSHSTSKSHVDWANHALDKLDSLHRKCARNINDPCFQQLSIWWHMVSFYMSQGPFLRGSAWTTGMFGQFHFRRTLADWPPPTPPMLELVLWQKDVQGSYIIPAKFVAIIVGHNGCSG